MPADTRHRPGDYEIPPGRLRRTARHVEACRYGPAHDPGVPEADGAHSSDVSNFDAL